MSRRMVGVTMLTNEWNFHLPSATGDGAAILPDVSCKRCLRHRTLAAGARWLRNTQPRHSAAARFWLG